MQLYKSLTLAAIATAMFTSTLLCTAATTENQRHLLRPTNNAAASPFIIGGDSVSQLNLVQSYPYAAQLHIDGEFMCGATAIAPRYLLTAAHCLEGPNGKTPTFNSARAVLNQTDIMSWSGHKPSNAIVRQFDSVFIHPKFDYYTLNNDIAIIKLSEDLPESIKPVALIENPVSARNVDSVPVTSLGWGKTKTFIRTPSPVLKLANSFLGTNDQCVIEASRIYLHEKDINKYFVCAPDNTQSVKNGGRDHSGDSGGPLLIKSGSGSSSENILIGVTSWGQIDAEPSFASFFTRVSAHKEFINKHVTGHRFLSPQSDLVITASSDDNPSNDGRVHEYNYFLQGLMTVLIIFKYLI